MPENLDTIHSKSTSHLAGSVPGTREMLMKSKVPVLACMELTVEKIDKEAVSWPWMVES